MLKFVSPKLAKCELFLLYKFMISFHEWAKNKKAKPLKHPIDKSIDNWLKEVDALKKDIGNLKDRKKDDDDKKNKEKLQQSKEKLDDKVDKLDDDEDENDDNQEDEKPEEKPIVNKDKKDYTAKIVKNKVADRPIYKNGE